MPPEARTSDAQWKEWRARIDEARKQRRRLKDVWAENVSFRIGKQLAAGEEDSVSVPIDWSRTRSKTAALASAVPQILLTAKRPQFAPATGLFANEVNAVLRRDCALDEALLACLADVTNAAGIAAVKVGYSATFEEVEVPDHDISQLSPEEQQFLIQSGAVKLVKVPRQVDEAYYATRISPANLLWDPTFTTSGDWDQAKWVGHEGTLPWSVAKRDFDLKAADKDKVLGEQAAKTLNTDQHDEPFTEPEVAYQEIYYRAHFFDPDCKYFRKLRRLVFVKGLDTPVIHEDLKWQRYLEPQTIPEKRDAQGNVIAPEQFVSGRYVGACKFPIRVLTLNYISDLAGPPPSDSQMARPQVRETIRSRTAIVQNRERSAPLRWADTNRIDADVIQNIENGVFQQIIPVNGPGDRAIGEIARAQFPPEDFAFQKIIGRDLDDVFGSSENAQGRFTTGERSASEANIVAQAAQTLVAMDRNRVKKFILGIAEVIGGLLQMFRDQPQEFVGGPEAMAQIDQVWNREMLDGAEFVYDLRVDELVQLDGEARFQRLLRAFNILGKTGYLKPEPVIAEMIALSGLDPAAVMTQPQPPGAEAPNVSFRFSGMEDLSNPIAVAMLMKAGQMPSEQEIQAAKLLLADAVAPYKPPEGGAPPPVPGAEVAPAAGPSPTETAEWGPADRVTKRTNEVGG